MGRVRRKRGEDSAMSVTTQRACSLAAMGVDREAAGNVMVNAAPSAKESDENRDRAEAAKIA